MQKSRPGYGKNQQKTPKLGRYLAKIFSVGPRRNETLFLKGVTLRAYPKHLAKRGRTTLGGWLLTSEKLLADTSLKKQHTQNMFEALLEPQTGCRTLLAVNR